MKLLLLLTFLINWTLCKAQTEQEINNYVNAIQDFISQGNNYEFPTNNSAYLNGRNLTSECENAEEYDFIIIGAGSAGSVIARRLTEIKRFTVLVIEAGGEETIITDIPGMFAYLAYSDFDWGYRTVPQTKSLFGFINNSERVPRGKVMGGSSTLNAMMYARGNKNDFNKWFAEGNLGWSYNDVLPYFKKSENANFTDPDFGYHGFNGPLNINFLNALSPLTSAYLEANQELDRNILDYNGRSQNGTSRVQSTQQYGRRLSAAKAFINPVRNRNNLKILTKSLVTKILIKNRKAFGVRYLNNGYEYCAYARRKVILSAGAINSPQLLMLSGIGPENELKKHGINVVQNLPGVGQNLWDHLFYRYITFTTNYSANPLTLQDQVQMYLNGVGPLTVAAGVQDLAFNFEDPNNAVPKTENIFTTGTPAANTTYNFNKNFFGFTQDTYDSVIQPLIGKSIWSVFLVLLHPKSRGSIQLQSSSPLDFPLINPNYFSNPVDLDVILAGIKKVIKISQTKTMQKYNSQLFEIDLPGCRNYTNGSDQHYRCLIQYLASTEHHWSGTCKMGPLFDKMSVVDTKLRVRGIQNLRVADCSVIPAPVSGHTNAIAIMIGEKVSDFLKELF